MMETTWLGGYVVSSSKAAKRMGRKRLVESSVLPKIGVAQRVKDYHMDAVFAAPGINLQLRTYHHEAPSRASKARQDHVLSFSLNGRPRGSTGRYVSQQRRTQSFRFGDITFVPGGVPIIGWGPGGVQKTLSCRIDYGAFKLLQPFEDRISEECLLACGDIRAPGMPDIMRRLVTELRSPGFARETMIELLVRAALVDVVRHVNGSLENPQFHSGGLSPLQLRRVTEYIESSLERSPTIAELAEACEISAGHLMRCFRQSTGETIHAHVQRVRLDRARLLLAQKERSIKEIAHLLGFATPSSFSVAFKRLCGQSPSEFRRSAH